MDSVPFALRCEHCGTAHSAVVLQERMRPGATFRQERLVCNACTTHYPGWIHKGVVLRRVPTSRLTQLRWIVTIAAARFFAWVRGRHS